MDGAEGAAQGARPGIVVETRGLTKSFGQRRVVEGVSLQVPAGSGFGFLGPNGAGKTTVIRMLLGLIRPSSGHIALLGHEMPRGRQAALARVGAIVEEPRFHSHLTGRENLRLVAAAREPEAGDRIEGALARVGLTKRADERVRSYSLGMRQRLGIARCLIADPTLLILDEPMNGLDPAGIHEFRQLVGSLTAEGRTVFLSSHLLDEIEKTCDHAAVIDRGRVIFQGPVEELGRQGGVAVVIGCGDPFRGLGICRSHHGVAAAELTNGLITVTLTQEASADPHAALSAVNRALVEAGIDVSRIEPVRLSLEQRFLAVTTRLQASP